MAQRTIAKTHGAERGLNRLEGFSDAVFAIALTLLIVEIKVPGAPDGPHGYSDLAKAVAEQWREHLALVLCYVVIGAYWLQHHYSGRIYAKKRSLVQRHQPPVPVGHRRHSLSDPRLVLSPRLGLRARRIDDPGRRPRPDGLHLDGEVVLRAVGPARDGRTTGARFRPADDPPLRHCDADPDCCGSARGHGAAPRSGHRAALRRILPAAAAEAPLQARRGAERGGEIERVAGGRSD